MNKLLILLCSCCVLLQACSKSKPHYTIDAGMKAAFNYLPGTYWIYKDSISGEEDSFAVTENFGTNTIDNGDSKVDYIDIYIYEYNALQPDSIRWIWAMENRQVNLEWDLKLEDITYGALFEFPFQIRPPIGNYPTLINILTTYTINGLSFSNVAIINVTDKNSNDCFFISSDAGIIKMQLNHPQDSINRVWELQRYHVVK